MPEPSEGGDVEYADEGDAGGSDIFGGRVLARTGPKYGAGGGCCCRGGCECCCRSCVSCDGRASLPGTGAPNSFVSEILDRSTISDEKPGEGGRRSAASSEVAAEMTLSEMSRPAALEADELFRPLGKGSNQRGSSSSSSDESLAAIGMSRGQRLP